MYFTFDASPSTHQRMMGMRLIPSYINGDRVNTAIVRVM